ncbi:hypothetical protein PVAP13_8KG379802 [Panicum virgatum]|uniref:Uncharacterized protein n=1 Tax=Panicum virgatum TaxID=38727 RepID=A0A8T0Q115_PANVG|nr:hypothetical protein PVAP13_8KG379802 [Panicum virgatum]
MPEISEGASLCPGESGQQARGAPDSRAGGQPLAAARREAHRGAELSRPGGCAAARPRPPVPASSQPPLGSGPGRHVQQRPTQTKPSGPSPGAGPHVAQLAALGQAQEEAGRLAGGFAYRSTAQ